jgi:hypothetical protein
MTGASIYDLPVMGGQLAASAAGTDGALGLHIAVVHTVDAVRLVAAARSRVALTDRLVDYVEREATERLWPDDARLLHQLLGSGQRDAAIEQYFTSVGRRWVEERLAIAVVPVQQQRVGPSP